MRPQTLCPDRCRLQDLLDGLLLPDEQHELTAHLDTCTDCQHTLDVLTDADPWPRRSHRTGPRPILESALRNVMEELKGQESAPPAGPDAEAEVCLDFLAPPTHPGQLGGLGSYEVTEVVGRGGMGVVLKAVDPSLNRFVAIKVMAPQLATSAAARRRFAREARAAAAISHEHVVAIHAVDAARGFPYLVMQYVPGVSLQERLDRGGPLELKEILRIGHQAACGLAAAHAQGLVHRDVKPANILLENGIERVKLTDFGLARAADDAGLTQSGDLAGTPQYMAPEQARGETVDHRADLFSLGSVLYALCTGRAPFRASTTLAVLKRVNEETPRPIREINADVPGWLTRIITKLHAKDPADRFQSAAEVADLLGRCLAHVQSPDTVALPPCPDLPVTPRRTRRWRLPAAALLVVGSLLAVTEATGATRMWQLAATVLRFPAGEGTLVVEVDDPEVKVTIDGPDVVITGVGVQEVRLRPGTYKLRATREGQPGFEEVVQVKRGGREVVKVRFEAGGKEAVKVPDKPADGAQTTLIRHGAAVLNAAFSHDGQRLISTASDQTVRVWDVATGTSSVTFTLGHLVRSRIVSSALYPDGKTLAVIDEGGRVRVLDTGTGEIQAELQLPDREIRIGGFPLNTTGRLFTGNANGEIRIWDADTGKLRAELTRRTAIQALAASPDGKILATGAREEAVAVWDVATGKQVLRLTPQGAVLSLAFSPDGKLLATASGPVVVWELSTGKPAATMKGHTGAVTKAEFSPDGRTVASGGADGTVRFWDVATSKEVAVFRGHAAAVTSVSFSRDGRRVVSGSADGTVKIWDVPDRRRPDADRDEELQRLRAERDAALRVAEQLQANELEARDRARAAEARAQEQRAQAERAAYAARIALAQQQWQEGKGIPDADPLNAFAAPLAGWEWEFLRRGGEGKAVVLHGHDGAVLAVAVSPDAKRLASGGADRRVRLWDAATGRQLAEPLPHPAPVRSLSFSPDGRRIASAGEDGTVLVWDAASGKEMMRLPGQPGGAGVLAWSPDMKLLAAHGDRSIRLWDTATGKEVFLLDHRPSAGITGLAFSPDGTQIATASTDGNVRVWDIKTGNILIKVVVGKDARLAFSPDARRLAVAGADGAIYFYDPQTGKEVFRLTGHEGAVLGLAYTPDGRRLATGGADKTVRLWNVEYSGEVLKLTGHTGAVNAVAFSPDGRLLVTGSADKTVRLGPGGAPPSKP